MSVRSINRTIIFLAAVFCLGEMPAQSPGFRFGPRVGIGICRFSRLPGFEMETGPAVQVGLVASHQFNERWGLEFAPMTSFYGANPKGHVQDGVDTTGRPRLFSYREEYRLGIVEFPVMAKIGFNMGVIRVSQLAGVSLGLNMFGIHSRRYDDHRYNEKHSYSDHVVRGIRHGAIAAVGGFCFELELGKGILGLDVRLNKTISPIGRIDGSKFTTESATFGISWKQ